MNLGAWMLHALLRASTEEPITLQEVLRSVQTHLPMVRAAQEDMAASRGRLMSAQGGFDPVVRGRGGATPFGEYTHAFLDTWVEQPTPVLGTSFYAGWRMGMGDFAPYDGKLATNGLGEIRGGVRVPLGKNLLLDGRRAGLERALLDVRTMDAATQQAMLEGSAAGGAAFLGWIAAGQRMRVQEELLEIAVVRNTQLQRRADSGDLPAVELVENQRAILSRQSAVVAARRGAEQAALNLALYLRGDDGNTRVPPRSRAPDRFPGVGSPLPELDGGVATALARRPEPYRLRLQEAQARVDVRLARNDALPGVDLWVEGSQDLGPGKYTRAAPEARALLTVEVPLPNRTGIGRIRTQEAALRKVKQQSRWVEDRIRMEVADALSAWRNARERVEMARREVEVAEQLEVAERRRFDLGEGTLLLVNIREQTTGEARLRVVDAELEESRAQLMWMAATGQLLPSGGA